MVQSTIEMGAAGQGNLCDRSGSAESESGSGRALYAFKNSKNRKELQSWGRWRPRRNNVMRLREVWEHGSSNLQCNEGEDGILGDWGGSEATRRCARIGFYVPQSQSCSGSSATRLLIAAVDLAFSHFRVRTGHEVSLGRVWVPKCEAWRERRGGVGGGWIQKAKNSNSHEDEPHCHT